MAALHALAADEAVRFLGEIGYDDTLFPAIHHAVAAHSYSAGIPVETVEAGVEAHDGVFAGGRFHPCGDQAAGQDETGVQSDG